jgi:hypothetical protein
LHNIQIYKHLHLHFAPNTIGTVKAPVEAHSNRTPHSRKVDEWMTLCGRLAAQLTTSQTENRRLLEATPHAALAGTG